MTLSQLALRALVIGVLVSAPALVTSSVTSESPCEALARWAEPYRGTSPTLDDVIRFDRARQIAIFNTIAPDARAALWQEHLRRFARRADLSDAQRALIAEAVGMATPALYERQPAAVQAFEQLWPRIDAAFTGEQERAWFNFGPTAARQRSSMRDRLASRFTANAQFSPCECNRGWQDCPWGICTDTIACNLVGGCGHMGMFACNGMCH